MEDEGFENGPLWRKKKEKRKRKKQRNTRE